MSREVPNIYTGNTVKKRDRESFKDFVIEVITDTFINEFTPTEISLDTETETLFTIVLGPVDANSDGDLSDRIDIKGYRFNYEDLQVDNAIDYIDVYLYGVKQNKNKYSVQLFDIDGNQLNSGQFAKGTVELRFVFNENITRVPTEVPKEAFTIRGKIVEIE